MSWENLEENLRSICMLSVSSARSVRRLSLPTLSAPSSLSGYSLTHAKRENGAKRAFEDRKPLKAEVGEKRRELLEESNRGIRKRRSRGKTGQESTKDLSFQEDSRF